MKRLITLKTERLRSYYILEVMGQKRHIQAVDGVEMEIKENEIYGIAGESGCGKTTLIKTLFAMVDPPLNVIEGTVYYRMNGKYIDVFSLTKEEIRKIRWEYISYIPQGSMSVLNPITKIMESFEDFITAHKKMKKEEIRRPVEEHLGALGLPTTVLDAYPHQLSGGMRQRVTIALATVMNPRIIIADEPTTALDVVAQRGVIQLLKEVQQKLKNTMILVTHDMGVHANVTDRIGIMYAGKIIEEASTIEIFENPMHPYTKYLIGSLPKMGDKTYRISAPGSPPSLYNPPSGCRFHPRCEKAMKICKEEEPKLVEIEKGHKVACFLHSREMEE